MSRSPPPKRWYLQAGPDFPQTQQWVAITIMIYAYAYLSSCCNCLPVHLHPWCNTPNAAHTVASAHRSGRGAQDNAEGPAILTAVLSEELPPKDCFLFFLCGVSESGNNSEWASNIMQWPPWHARPWQTSIELIATACCRHHYPSIAGESVKEWQIANLFFGHHSSLSSMLAMMLLLVRCCMPSSVDLEPDSTQIKERLVTMMSTSLLDLTVASIGPDQRTNPKTQAYSPKGSTEMEGIVSAMVAKQGATGAV